MPKTDNEFINEVREQIGEDFLTIKFKIGDSIFKKNVLEELADYDPNDIALMQRAFSKQPIRLAEYGIAWKRAKKTLAGFEHDEKKWRREKRRKINISLSETWKSKKIRKSPTKEDVDAEIDTKFADEADEYQAKKAKWQEIVDIMEVIYEAWKQRKDMLVTGGNLMNRLIDNHMLEIPTYRKKEK